MKNYKWAVVGMVIVAQTLLFAAVSVEPDYRGWKWDDVHVAKNEYISVAVVPDSGGRILEYNLGDVPSLWVNPDMLGKSFEATDELKGNEWRNFGGYRIVPIPVDESAVGKKGGVGRRWPPPAILGSSPYTAKIGKDSQGRETIEVVSGIQELPVPSVNNKTGKFRYPKQIDVRLQYKRSLRIEPGTSLVHIRHTLLNRGDQTMKRGLKITSQQISRSRPELTDGENFRAYIPFDANLKIATGEPYRISGSPKSRWRFVNDKRRPLDENNPEHVAKYRNKGTNWKGEVAEGIFEIHYDYDLMAGFDVIAAKPWVCYVNQLENTAFAKLIEPYDPSLDYELGSNLAIYNSGASTGYLETEVRTPLFSIPAGGKAEYRETHGAARIASTPVLDVNLAGIITKRLSLGTAFHGEYGVFRAGAAVLRLKGPAGKPIREIKVGEVNPFKAFILQQKLDATGAQVAEVLIRTEDGEYLLDHCQIYNIGEKNP